MLVSSKKDNTQNIHDEILNQEPCIHVINTDFFYRCLAAKKSREDRGDFREVNMTLIKMGMKPNYNLIARINEENKYRSTQQVIDSLNDSYIIFKANLTENCYSDTLLKPDHTQTMDKMRMLIELGQDLYMTAMDYLTERLKREMGL